MGTRSMPTIDTQTWWWTPASRSASSRLCVPVTRTRSAFRFGGPLLASITASTPSRAACRPAPVGGAVAGGYHGVDAVERGLQAGAGGEVDRGVGRVAGQRLRR